MKTDGMTMFELVTEHLARRLLEAMEKASPADRALVTRREADEALLDALDALANDPGSAQTLHVIERARDIHLSRTMNAA